VAPVHIGIVPAAGRGTRLATTATKELLPVGTVADPLAGLRPRRVSEYVLESMTAAQVAQVILVISPGKQDVSRFYGAGDRHGVDITYCSQAHPTGMADAIDTAYPSTRNAIVLLGMPDTVFRPLDALAALRDFRERDDADLALGVFPTEEGGRLGPVRVDAGGVVVEVLDKPDCPPLSNTWGIACWGPAFTELLHAEAAAWPLSRELPLGAVFQSAVQHGFRVRALQFPGGAYFDVGTPGGLARARRAVAGWAGQSVDALVET
jgi:glucose-1-phosphate thymidylyltransferase